MEHTGSAEGIDRKGITCSSRSNGHMTFPCRCEQLGNRNRPVREQRLRDEQFADVKAGQECGHGIEVVGVGMRNDERVDPSDTLAPEQRFDCATSR
jgi:hypothetical protein